MSVKLTEGAVENICPVENKAGPPRFRLLMSDGRHSLSSESQALFSFWLLLFANKCFVLSSQLNTLVDEKQLVPYCLCKLKKTTVNVLADGRHVVIVIDMEVAMSAEETGERIGAPTPLISGAAHSPGYGVGGAFSKKTPSNSPAKTPTHSPAKTQASPVKVVPIASLNPYQNKFELSTKKWLIFMTLCLLTRWTIKARVTNKSQIRTWSNSRGDGKLFSIDVIDESGEIKITAFNNEVDKFFPLVENDQVYCISKATIKMANKKYSTLKNDYEISLHSNTTIVPCGDSEGVPTLSCDFVPIAELENREKDDIIGKERNPG
ncbi:unnamed protein product [Merluccius merluccius]